MVASRRKHGSATGLSLDSDVVVFTTAFDAFVAVFVVVAEILKQIPVFFGDMSSSSVFAELCSESNKCRLVKIVLMGLHVAELREALVAII